LYDIDSRTYAPLWHLVIQASNGCEALELARNHNADLILMDIQMPVMDGIEAIKRLRTDGKTAGIKIIAVTAFVLEEEKQRILETGVDGYLTKPIDTRKLPVIVQQILDGIR